MTQNERYITTPQREQRTASWPAVDRYLACV